jgi:hypothetical protein
VVAEAAASNPAERKIQLGVARGLYVVDSDSEDFSYLELLSALRRVVIRSGFPGQI